MKITITFNNMIGDSTLKADWGMVAVIDTGDEKILFDTGSDGKILFNNLERLGISLSDMNHVIISHNHWDHTGGLELLLDKHPGITVHIPEIDSKLHDSIVRKDARLKISKTPEKITSGCFCSEVLTDSRGISEQALIIKGKQGYTVLTGCAHPGVSKLARLAPEPRYLVTGGFHLYKANHDTIAHCAEELAALNVKYLAPSHCTGEKAIKFFKNRFHDKILDGSLGVSFEI